MNDMHMKQLLTLMLLVDWLANDLHYNSRGREFYEKHLLADRVRDLGSDDELKEAYWLGFKNMSPPPDSEIAGMTIAAYAKIVQGCDAMQALAKAFGMTLETVEACKAEAGLPSGVHALLDDVSKKALTYKFLIQASLG